ncbi:hypothetical protein BDV97DRAFT_373424 [Delphinella strobiligena]|nr:hypothetical protein BDV97DRAFT_373424 [Delphinella strobiligena]
MATPSSKRQCTENGRNNALPGIALLFSDLTAPTSGNTAVQGHVLPSLHSTLPGYLSETRHHDAGLGFAASTQYDAGLAPVQQSAANPTYPPAPGIPSSAYQPPLTLSGDSKRLHHAIETLTDQERQEFLYEAAVSNPDIRQLVYSRYYQIARTRNSNVVYFGPYDVGDWWDLQVDLDDYLCDDPAYDAMHVVNQHFASIVSRVYLESSIKTKRNALEAFADIMLNIWQSDRDEADELRERMPDESTFSINLMRCLKTMTAAELADLRANDEDVLEKFDILVDLIGGDDGLPELQPAIQLLRGAGSDNNDGASNDTSEDYEREEREEVVADDDNGEEDEEQEVKGADEVKRKYQQNNC